MKEINGDLISLSKQGLFDIITHGCNCFCTMGAGLAKQIKSNFKEAYDADLITEKGDFNKLGNYTYAYNKKYNLIIINSYIQYRYGGNKINIDYPALTLCMKKINHNFKGSSIGLPLIGTGLAGGEWELIKQIIDSELKDMDVTIVYYDK